MYDYVKRHLHDEKCVSVLESILAATTLLDFKEVPAFLAAYILIELHNGGVWYPTGGSGTIPSVLLESFRKSGGRYEAGIKVSEILVGGGRARGIRLENGQIIHAERVISDVPKEHTFGKLIDNIHLSDGLRKQVAYQENADSFFGVFLGVDAAVVPAGAAVHTIVMPKYTDIWRDARPVLVSIPSIIDKSLAPTGKHTITLLSPEKTYGWERNQYYEQKKQEYAREKIAIAERILPGLSRASSVTQIASPLTWESSTLRPKGTFGIKMDIRQGQFNRMGNKTEISNLYCVSDATFPGSGVSSVAYSGTQCANLICRECGRRFPSEDELPL